MTSLPEIGGHRFHKLKPLSLSDLAALPARSMLVKGLLGEGEFSVVFGEPKCGKSFLVTHLGLAIAAGENWFGKKVKPGAVLYIAAEGAGGFPKRIEAYRREYDIADDTPFHVIASSVDLRNHDADLEEIIYWAMEIDAVLVVVDTLSRSLAGGNENGPEDMGAFIGNCDRIREKTGAHVLVVHHKPKGERNTPRGHSSLFGAVDTMLSVSKKSAGGNVAKVEACKDDADGWEFGFDLDVVDVGEDDDGDAVTSCVIVPSDHVPEEKTKRLTGDRAVTWDALHDVLSRSGKVYKYRTGIPDNANCVNVEAWRQEFYARASDKPSYDAKKKAFGRAMNALRDAGKVAFRDELAWAVKDEWSGGT